MHKFLAGGIVLIVLGGMMAASVVAANADSAHDAQAAQAFADLATVLESISEKANGFRGPQPPDPPLCDILAIKPDTCTIHVNIIQTYDASSSGVPYGCILKVDDVTVISSVKKIKWRLQILSSASAASDTAVLVSSSTVPPYIFYKRFEILPVRDDSHQIGARTSGTDGSASASYAYQKGLRIKYYPVVVQNPDAEDEKSKKTKTGKTKGQAKPEEILCGSLDPKIVNN